MGLVSVSVSFSLSASLSQWLFITSQHKLILSLKRDLFQKRNKIQPKNRLSFFAKRLIGLLVPVFLLQDKTITFGKSRHLKRFLRTSLFKVKPFNQFIFVAQHYLILSKEQQIEILFSLIDGKEG